MANNMGVLFKPTLHQTSCYYGVPREEHFHIIIVHLTEVMN